MLALPHIPPPPPMTKSAWWDAIAAEPDTFPGQGIPLLLGPDGNPLLRVTAPPKRWLKSGVIGWACSKKISVKAAHRFWGAHLSFELRMTPSRRWADA